MTQENKSRMIKFLWNLVSILLHIDKQRVKIYF